MTVSGVLLAAGRGERLRPLTDLVPKPALPVLDIPLGLASLRALLVASEAVVVNVSHLGERVVRELGCAATKGIEILDEGGEPYGTAGTLAALRPRLRGTVLVANGDVLSDLDPRALLKRHAAAGATATLAVQMVSRGADLGTGGGFAVGFIDRRRTPDAAGARYLGMAAFEPAALEELPDRRPLGLGEAVLRPLAEAGQIAIHVHEGYALDVGTIGRYLQANDDLLNGRIRTIAPPGQIVEPAGGGRAYLGPGARAEPGSLGSGAVILGGATVAPDALVSEAVVWPNERVPAGARIAHAVWFEGRAVYPGSTEETARPDP
ncbi:MAG: NDP-sugar synthase [Actinomycetota bacterium]|nr:NDP-sugar synthase [Actinomycetota bacterium]